MDLCATFGLSAMPFTRELRIDQRFALKTNDQALAGLRQVVSDRMSGVLLAAAGLGKTTLLRALVAGLPEARYRVHYTKVSNLSRRDMCREIAAAVGIAPTGTYPALVRRLQEHLTQVTDVDGVRPVLILDDAHDMRPEVLGLVRILTNFEMDSRLVVSIVLAGQLPLSALLKRAELEDVARRMAFCATLRPMSRDELGKYIEHRCRVAGARKSLFDGDAQAALFEMSRGNMRATDRLALRALQLASGADCKVADANHVTEARAQLWP